MDHIHHSLYEEYDGDERFSQMGLQTIKRMCVHIKPGRRFQTFIQLKLFTMQTEDSNDPTNPILPCNLFLQITYFLLIFFPSGVQDHFSGQVLSPDDERNGGEINQKAEKTSENSPDIIMPMTSWISDPHVYSFYRDRHTTTFSRLV